MVYTLVYWHYFDFRILEDDHPRRLNPRLILGALYWLFVDAHSHFTPASSLFSTPPSTCCAFQLPSSLTLSQNKPATRCAITSRFPVIPVLLSSSFFLVFYVIGLVAIRIQCAVATAAVECGLSGLVERLMLVLQDKDNFISRLIYFIGFSTSIIALLIALFIFTYFR